MRICDLIRRESAFGRSQAEKWDQKSSIRRCRREKEACEMEDLPVMTAKISRDSAAGKFLVLAIGQ